MGRYKLAKGSDLRELYFNQGPKMPSAEWKLLLQQWHDYSAETRRRYSSHITQFLSREQALKRNGFVTPDTFVEYVEHLQTTKGCISLPSYEQAAAALEHLQQRQRLLAPLIWHDKKAPEFASLGLVIKQLRNTVRRRRNDKEANGYLVCTYWSAELALRGPGVSSRTICSAGPRTH
jgi:hypothetical protein